MNLPTHNPGRRLLMVVAAALLVAGCQTTAGHQQAPYSDAQIAALQAHGFQEADGDWSLGLSGPLLFPFDTSELAETQRERIVTMARNLREVGISGARIEGHTDSVGTLQYNQQLSLRRAEVVKSALAAGGMDEQRIQARGKASAQPIADNATPEGRRENRRVVILISPGNAASD